MAEHGPVREVADQLSRIFRHLLPGVLILAAARASHPRWFVHRFDYAQPWHLAVLAVVAIMVGNTWYVAHRYTVHQLFDVLIYTVRRSPRRPKGYPDWLSKHVHDGNLFPPYADDLRQHVLFRSAQVIYLFILCEVLIFFAACPAPNTLFARHQVPLIVGGGVILLFAFWQYYLSYRTDLYAVEQFGGKRRAMSNREHS